jgi:hypothetical protein
MTVVGCVNTQSQPSTSNLISSSSIPNSSSSSTTTATTTNTTSSINTPPPLPSTPTTTTTQLNSVYAEEKVFKKEKQILLEFDTKTKGKPTFSFYNLAWRSYFIKEYRHVYRCKV